MKRKEIKAKANKTGIKNTFGLSKAELIRRIQRTEGNFDCFGKAKGYCDQLQCHFRVDCLKDTEVFSQKVLSIIPLILAIAMIVFIYFKFKEEPVFVDYLTLVSGALSEAQKQTISIAIELNKFLVSLTTLMFGALGFYLTKYKNEFEIRWVAAAFFISLIFLGLTYYYAFHVYSQLTGELAQNALAIQPGKSRILYYFEREFWTSLGASLILLFLFVFVLFSKKRN
jgi:hypothetical protein